MQHNKFRKPSQQWDKKFELILQETIKEIESKNSNNKLNMKEV
jgi:hypothetical protein